jgi:carnitine-CoA ligase
MKRSSWTLGEQDTVIHALARAVAKGPDRVLFDFAGDLYTYREVDLLTNRLANAFKALGVQRGQTVVTMLDNSIDAVVAWLALNKIAAISVPINTALRGEFLRHQVTDAGAAIVICEHDFLERLAAIAHQLPDVKLILRRGPATDVACAIAVKSFDDHRGHDDTPQETLPNPSDLSCLIYTSGTTGPSKGCMVSFNYLCNIARLKLRGAPATSDDITFTTLPLFHQNAVASGVITTILSKGRIAFAPRFSVSNFWPEVERTGATILSILGGIGTLLAKAADNDALLRCVGKVHTVRGNPFHGETKAIWHKRFGVRHVGSMDYGLTEVCVVTSLPTDGYVDAAPGSSGLISPGFDVRIFDDNRNEVPVGTPGEVVVRPLQPDIMFQGYWRRPADTLNVMRDQWFHTGDIGKFDDKGYLYFVDRKKDYLRRRGENISSYEMEMALAAHEAINDVAVHAVFSPLGEDDLKVTATLKSGHDLAPETLFEWAQDKVPHYALPRFIEFRASLPRNPQGKVLKYQLRDEGVTPGTWDLERSGIKVV